LCVFVQEYVEIAGRMECPAPLSESPANALLTEKKANKKALGTRKSLRRKATPEASSKEDEEDSSPKGKNEKKKKKRPPRPKRMGA